MSRVGKIRDFNIGMRTDRQAYKPKYKSGPGGVWPTSRDLLL